MSDLIGNSLGNYHVLNEIGQGGMATVFKAVDVESGCQVAAKVLLPHLGREETFKARFRREVKVLSALDHPNIIPILDWGELNGHTYLILPYMEIGTLSDRLSSGPIAIQEGLKIFSQIALALHGINKLCNS